VNRCAAGLQALGVRKGDRVALMMSNCPQFVVSYFGVLKAGRYRDGDQFDVHRTRGRPPVATDAGPSALIVDRKLQPVAKIALAEVPEVKHVIVTGSRDYYPAAFREARQRPSHREVFTHHATQLTHHAPTLGKISSCSPRSPHPAPVKPADIACLQYTGGTTGTSKGAMLTHANLVTNAYQTEHWLSCGEHRSEVMVAALPLFHIYAMTCVMISSVFAGGTVIILPRFELP